MTAIVEAGNGQQVLPINGGNVATDNETTKKVEKVANSKGSFIGASLISGTLILGALASVALITIAILGSEFFSGALAIGVTVAILVVCISIAVFEAYKAVQFAKQAMVAK